MVVTGVGNCCGQVISQTGVYYVGVEGAACATGGFELSLTVNDATTVFTIYHNLTNGAMPQTRGQEAILQLNAGDRLQVALHSPTSGSSEPYCLWGERLTGFYGFLLSPPISFHVNNYF